MRRATENTKIYSSVAIKRDTLLEESSRVSAVKQSAFRMEKRPIAGSLLVVDRVSDVKAFACVTYHPDNPDRYDAPKRYNQYNPCNYPYVAEIVNYERRLAQTTHFLALSCGIEFAEYRLVQQPVADVPQNTVIFFDDLNAAYSNHMVPEDPAAVRAYLDRK